MFNQTLIKKKSSDFGMFDIGFWELAIIGVVALLVIGPERMPEMNPYDWTMGGAVQRLISNLKRDRS